MREDALGELETTISYQTSYHIDFVETVLGRTVSSQVDDMYTGRVGAFIDTENGMSQPFKMPGEDRNATTKNISEKIANCTGPETETKGIFRKKEVVIGCTALEHLQITNLCNKRTSVKRKLLIDLTGI